MTKLLELILVAMIAFSGDNSEGIVGKWEVVKGPAPPGATIEYFKDGTIKLRATVGGKPNEYTGTYTVSGKEVASKIKYNGRQKLETHTIKRLTDDELDVVDEKGQVQKCVRVGSQTAKNGIVERPVVANPRFTPDAIELFGQVTNSYDLNGERQPAGTFDVAVMSKLRKEGTPEVRKLVEQAAQLKWLNGKNKTQNAEVCKVFQDQIRKWPELIVKTVIASVDAPQDERGDISAAVKIIEGMMGNKPQEAVNEAWAVACFGNGTANSLKDEIRSLARKGRQSDVAPDYALDVVIDSGYSISVINQTKTTLHNCVLFTRLFANNEAVLMEAQQEDLVGAFVLPFLGFSPETVQGSRDAARLRHSFHLQDKGVMLYLPELPPGGKVTTGLAAPAYFRVAKGADISLWCDEWSLEHQAARNWDDLKTSRNSTSSESGEENADRSKSKAAPNKRPRRPR